MIRGASRRLAALAVTAVAGLALTACTSSSSAVTDGDPLFPEARLTELVDALPAAPGTENSAARLAAGLVPPTNTWFSGLVFGDTPQPVFPLPLAFAATESGPAFGLPEVTSTADVIAGPFQPRVAVDLGAAGFEVSAYDDLTATLAFADASGNQLADVTVARGWPYVALMATAALDAELTEAFEPASDGVWSATVAGEEYGLVAADATLSDDGRRLQLPEGARAAFFAVPEEGPDLAELAQGGEAAVTGSSVSYRAEGDRIETVLSYRTVDGEPTYLAALPHQQSAGAQCGEGTYPSIYGPLALCAGTSLAFALDALPASGRLDLASLSGEDRAALEERLRLDAAEEPPPPGDTYFGGKWLYRLANLVQLADSLGLDDVHASLTARLADQLRMWTEVDGCAARDAFCFTYDHTLRGIVGQTASFGSDEFNDHHFHYGYFLYAAAVAAEADPSVTADLQPVIDLLAADVAMEGESSLFPQRRNFDEYSGHSWASGFSPFADGNNQESTSEAVTAWNGLALWAEATGNERLKGEADWMLASEAATAMAYWVEPDLETFPGYDHGIVALNWGGKRDYATWFSPAPAAKLGIQLLPMSPVSGYLAGDDERIAANVSEASAEGIDVQFGDYLLMYAALGGADRGELIEQANSLAPESIDGANSRSYLMAWMLSR
ncbi:glycosyl hydrolase [Naasia sp. SYSU D00948]|uniref:glycosyl hydrolase n=1 Tax=Naasia sp. SYSU D00948 TaxID=2817379 RepID=UPI001B30E76E|nr:glycosyl hydrolase [Naasia sp. SYSU D00948]